MKPTPESEIEPKSRRHKVTGWGPLAAIAVTIGSFFAAQLLAGLLIGLYGVFRGMSEAQLEDLVYDSAGGRFALNLLFQGSILFLIWLFLRKRGIALHDLGIRKPKAGNFLLALPVFVAYLFFLAAVLMIAGRLIPGIDLDQKQEIGFDTAAYGKDLILIFIALVVLTPIVEEIVMRGFLYGGLKNGLPKLQAALITSLIFGIAHLQLGSSADSPLWTAAIGTFLLSMALVWLRERTGNIWSGVAVHMMKNGLAFASIFVFHLS